MITYETLTENRIDFHLGCQDTIDQHLTPIQKISKGVLIASVRSSFFRSDSGRMALCPTGMIFPETVHPDLWSAGISSLTGCDLE